MCGLISIRSGWLVLLLLAFLLVPSPGSAQVFSFAAPQNFEVSFFPDWIAVGDLNHDGHDDAVVSHYSALNVVAVLLGDGAGGFGPATNVSVGSGFNTPTSICLGDFDEDGNLDLAVTKVNVNNLAILRGNGLGGFGPPADRFLLNGSPESVTAVHIDADTHLDLVFADRGTGSAGVLLGNGDGTFGGLARFPVAAPDDPFPGFSEPLSVAVGDFNADQAVDLAVTFRVRDPVAVLLGDGSGNFGVPIIVPLADPLALEVDPTRVVAADLDDDGALDLAVVQAFNARVSVLTGDGNGGFALSQTFTGTAPLGNAISRDFNGGGLADLAWVNAGSPGSVLVAPGQLSGALGSAETFSLVPNGNGSSFVAAGNFDGDCSPDLLTANRASKNVSLLLNAISNTAPIADAGADVDTIIGESVALDGSGSSDPDGDPIAFGWALVSQPEGSAASLTGEATESPSLVPDRPGTYEVELVVDDGSCGSEPDTVNVVTLTAFEIIDEIRAVIAGLPAADFKSGGFNSFSRLLGDVQNLLVKGNAGAAIRKTQDLKKHVDGCADASGTADGNDWIIHCPSQIDLRRLVDGLIRTLELSS